MHEDGKIDYLEFPADDVGAVKAFYGAAFGALSSPPPATTLLVVKDLADPAYLVEIEAVAAA